MSTSFGTKKEVIEVSYKEVDKVITETYGHNFECIADQEWSNDESHCVIFRKETIPDYDQTMIDEFARTGCGQFLLYTLMQDMVNRDIIPEGDYVINISW